MVFSLTFSADFDLIPGVARTFHDPLSRPFVIAECRFLLFNFYFLNFSPFLPELLIQTKRTGGSIRSCFS